MKIIFRAHDGKEFDNAQDCVTYEKAHPIYRMWDECGETKDLDAALLVDTQGNVDLFIKDCLEADVLVDGICGNGLYIWSRDHYEWVRLDTDVQNAILKYIRNE
jgi:hypothetical protein